MQSRSHVMEGIDASSDHVISEMLLIGFERPQILEAIEEVGPSIERAVEYIVDGGSRKKDSTPISGPNCSASNPRASGKRVGTRQSSILNFLKPSSTPKRIKTRDTYVPKLVEEENVSLCNDDRFKPVVRSSELHACNQQVQEIGPDWENKVKDLLRKHFGFSSLKSFQKEVLEAWLANQDCLVLAATGSGTLA